MNPYIFFAGCLILCSMTLWPCKSQAQIHISGDTLISGQVFDGQSEQALSEKLSLLITSAGPQDTVRISRCIFRNYSLENGALIQIKGARNVLIDSCIFYNIAGTRPGVDVHAIVCPDEGRQITISNSIFRNIAADGIQLGHLRNEKEQHQIHDWTISGNAFYDSGENGIDIKNTQGNIRIQENFFSGSRGCSGGRPGCSGDAGIGVIIHQGARGVRLQANTFYHNNRGVSVKQAKVGGIPQDIHIEENLFYGNISQTREAGWGLKLDAVEGAVIRHNVFVDNHPRRDLLIKEQQTSGIVLEANKFLSPEEFARSFSDQSSFPFPLLQAY